MSLFLHEVSLSLEISVHKSPQRKFFPLQWISHGTAMGTKTAVSFANIFMVHIETTILSRTVFKPTVWKRYIDDIFSLWDISKPDIEAFIEQANLHHPTIKFTAEISDTETVFLDTVVYKGTRFKEKSILDVKTHFKKRKPSSTHISPLVTRRLHVKKVFVKGEALRILQTNSSRKTPGRNQRQPAVNLRAYACFPFLSKYWHRNDV